MSSGSRAWKPNPLPKDSVRQLLFERISGYASPRYFAEHTWLVVWDLSDARELIDFSADIAEFRDLVSHYPLNSALTPALLGGLSHDWPGIQIADFIANLALHRYGQMLALPDAKADRAAAFEKHFRSILKHDNAGKEVGWKIW